MSLKQAHIFYSGIVQGVGFRYTVQRYASLYRLTGWVRNLKDGRVEALLEGKGEEIRKVLENIDNQFEGSIKKKEVFYSEPQNKFQNFRIVF